MSTHAPDEFRRVLEHPVAPIVIGGQAVNIWALYYLKKRPQLNEFAPFLSKDCDIFVPKGGEEEIARDSGWHLVRAKGGKASPVRAFLKSKDAVGNSLLVEVLWTVYGMESDDLKKHADLDIDGLRVRVLTPPVLLKGKIENMQKLPQAGRQDLKHVRILIGCVAETIAENLLDLELGNIKSRSVIRLLEYCRSVVTSPGAIRLARTEGLDWNHAFPPRLSRTPSPQVERFCRHRLPIPAPPIKRGTTPNGVVCRR